MNFLQGALECRVQLEGKIQKPHAKEPDKAGTPKNQFCKEPDPLNQVKAPGGYRDELPPGTPSRGRVREVE